jgi:hypothetical protein
VTALLLDLGDRVTGQVLDEAWWQRESRARPVDPPRHVVGEVAVIYPYAPHIVGVVLGSGERVTVRTQR